MTGLAAVRDEVLRRADIAQHAERAGFRRGPGRAWYCGFHPDEHPSCSIRENLIRCWSQCSRCWNAIDLQMTATNIPYVEALRQLADEYGVPWPSGNRRRLASLVERGEHERREEAEFFRIAATCMAEEILDELPEAVPERYPQTRFVTGLRAAHGGELPEDISAWLETRPSGGGHQAEAR